MVSIVINILFITVFIYCATSVLYLFVLSFLGRFFYRQLHTDHPGSKASKSIAILVPAYKEDGIILSTAENLLQLDYPRSLYDVYIIADSFRPETLNQLRQLQLNVFEVSFEKSTKIKSLNDAFSRIGKSYDIALICDADNMLAKDFLTKIDVAFSFGAKAVQGRRVAKNLDSPFAILDACSEAINNHIFRKGPAAIGLSSSVIGSGMAFDFAIIQQVLSEIKAVGGFDKILQLKVVKRGIPILYLEDAVIFDEKVDTSQAFKQQRKRWVSSQFVYLRKFFFSSFRYLFKGNLSYFNLGFMNNMVLPRSFLFIILPLLAVGGFFINRTLGILSCSLMFFFLICLCLAVPRELVNKNLFRALLQLPRAILIMLGTLLHLRKANKSFIHTVHTKTQVSNTRYNPKEP